VKIWFYLSLSYKEYKGKVSTIGFSIAPNSTEYTNNVSGSMNSNSGKTGKVFTLNRNERSRTTRIGVHIEPEWLFTLSRNMHFFMVVVSSRLVIGFSQLQLNQIGTTAS